MMSRNLELANALARSNAEVAELKSKLEKAKRGLAWAWHGDTDTSGIDWDAYFDSGEQK
jgi:hypothetical protein